MARKKRHWFWNLLIVITLVICGIAFAAHYKNWTRIEPDHIEILSGLYFVEVPYHQINSLELVPRIPHMERINGFSAGAHEKGVFKDSVNPGQKVYVYIDDLTREKIKMRFRDSLLLYLNFKDSTETRTMYNLLQNRMEALTPMD